MLYLLNLVITTVLCAATLYRVKIEHDQAKAMMEELRLKKKIQKMRKLLISERASVLEAHSAKDIRELYDTLIECLEEDNQ